MCQGTGPVKLPDQSGKNAGDEACWSSYGQLVESYYSALPTLSEAYFSLRNLLNECDWEETNEALQKEIERQHVENINKAALLESWVAVTECLGGEMPMSDGI